VRMPGDYGELFLRFFYDDTMVGYARDFRIKNVKIVSYTPRGWFTAHHPLTNSDGSIRDKIFKDCPKSWVSSVSIEVKDPKNKLVITPYLANAIELRRSNPQLRVLTLRPSQGQQAQDVIIDFVKPVFSRFINNTSMVVAMSRFCNSMTIPWVCKAPSPIMNLLSGYRYLDDQPISANYVKFVDLFAGRLAGNCPDSLSWVKCRDHNGDFFLKWWFFLQLVERCLALSDSLPYPLSDTLFENYPEEYYSNRDGYDDYSDEDTEPVPFYSDGYVFTADLKADLTGLLSKVSPGIGATMLELFLCLKLTGHYNDLLYHEFVTACHLYGFDISVGSSVVSLPTCPV